MLILYFILSLPVGAIFQELTELHIPVIGFLFSLIGGVGNFLTVIFRIALVIFFLRNLILGTSRSLPATPGQNRNQKAQAGRNVNPQPAQPQKPQPAFKERVQPEKKPDIHPWAAAQLAEMKNDLDDVLTRRSRLDALMSDFFGNSKISITRYNSVIDSSIEVLKTNYQKASQAARLFNAGEPLPEEAKEIIVGYHHDSNEIVADLNKVILALLKTHQDEVIGKNETLDSMLDELVESTSLYGTRQSQSDK